MSKPKNSWNQIKPCHEIFLNIFHEYYFHSVNIRPVLVMQFHGIFAYKIFKWNFISFVKLHRNTMLQYEIRSCPKFYDERGGGDKILYESRGTNIS